MLELALGSGILVTVFTASFQYGYIFYQYNTLYNAVQNGAHYAALTPYTEDCNTPIPSSYSTAVKNMVVYGNPSGTGSPVLTGLAVANVSVTVTGVGTCNDTWAPSGVTVSIGGTGITPYTINGIFGSFSANGKPKVAYPFMGLYQPPT